jgi:SAM-dependent methyltransferase
VVLTRTDKAWERFGVLDPYYGVLAQPEFRRERLSDDAIAQFFASGEAHVEAVLRLVRDHLVPDFAPRRVLDIGCGVGRLTIPLARRAREVVGVDVSSGMLEEARRTCDRLGVTNVALVQSGDALAGVGGPFDFVHSFIVFQHISPRRGEAIVRRAIELLDDGGVGSLHFAYDFRGVRLIDRAQAWVRRWVPLAHYALNIARGRSPAYPHMDMHRYDPARLFALLQNRRCDQSLVRFTDHGGYRGFHLVFQKRALPAL